MKYHFRAGRGKNIIISDTKTFEDLGFAILKEYHIDPDHLFMFVFSNGEETNSATPLGPMNDYRDVRRAFGEEFESETLDPDFFQTLENIVQKSGRKMFWICDEWDLFFREECDDKNAPDNYLEFLRALFKSSTGFTTRVFAGAADQGG